MYTLDLRTEMMSTFRFSMCCFYLFWVLGWLSGISERMGVRCGLCLLKNFSLENSAIAFSFLLSLRSKCSLCS